MEELENDSEKKQQQKLNNTSYTIHFVDHPHAQNIHPTRSQPTNNIDNKITFMTVIDRD